MTKIKITKDIKEYEGNVEDRVATPFGNSAHINVGKKHTGKILSVIAPTNPKYKWVLPKSDLNRVVKKCGKILEKDNGKLKHYKKELVKNLQDSFSIGDLYKVIDILKKDKKNISLVKTIKTTYGL